MTQAELDNMTPEQEAAFIESLLTSPGWEWFVDGVLKQAKGAALHHLLQSDKKAHIHRARGAYALAEELEAAPHNRLAFIRAEQEEAKVANAMEDLSPGSDDADEYGKFGENSLDKD